MHHPPTWSQRTLFANWQILSASTYVISFKTGLSFRTAESWDCIKKAGCKSVSLLSLVPLCQTWLIAPRKLISLWFFFHSGVLYITPTVAFFCVSQVNFSWHNVLKAPCFLVFSDFLAGLTPLRLSKQNYLCAYILKISFWFGLG